MKPKNKVFLVFPRLRPIVMVNTVDLFQLRQPFRIDYLLGAISYLPFVRKRMAAPYFIVRTTKTK